MSDARTDATTDTVTDTREADSETVVQLDGVTR